MQLKKLISIFLYFISFQSFAQKNYECDSLRQFVIAARFYTGFILAQNIHVQNTKGVQPAGFEFEYTHLKSDFKTNNFFKCFPRTGFAFTYVDFNSHLLGKAYALNYLIEPNYRVSNTLKLNFRVDAGMAYLTNPHNNIKNPLNESYSGHINNFFELNGGFSCALNDHLQVYASGNFFHYSNGGFKLPNAGINYINYSLGLQYFQCATHLPVYKKKKDSAWKKENLHADIATFYSPKNGYRNDSSVTRKSVFGINAQLIKRINNIDAVTFGGEVYLDEGLGSIKKVFLHDATSSNLLAGLLIGHQFLLNRFTFSQQLGLYIFKQTKKYNDNYADLYHTIYHRWGIAYNVKHNWSVGIMLLAHNQVSDFIDGRLIYRLR